MRVVQRLEANRKRVLEIPACHPKLTHLFFARYSIAVLDASKDHFMAWRNLAERPEAVVRAASEARQWREEEASQCLAAVAKSRYRLIHRAFDAVVCIANVGRSAVANRTLAPQWCRACKLGSAGPVAVGLAHAAIPHVAGGGKGAAGALLLGWAASDMPDG